MESESARLIRHLRRCAGMFSLAFVRWNHSGKETACAKTIHEKAPQLRIRKIRLKKNDAAAPLPAIKEAANLLPLPDALFVYGLEKAFPPMGQEQDESLPVTRNLNLQRDAFRKYVSIPLIFWLPDSCLNTIARNAPDFWSWRSSVFSFELPTMERQRIESMLAL
jgi:hypothetical protein